MNPSLLHHLLNRQDYRCSVHGVTVPSMIRSSRQLRSPILHVGLVLFRSLFNTPPGFPDVNQVTILTIYVVLAFEIVYLEKERTVQ